MNTKKCHEISLSEQEILWLEQQVRMTKLKIKHMQRKLVWLAEEITKKKEIAQILKNSLKSERS